VFRFLHRQSITPVQHGRLSVFILKDFQAAMLPFGLKDCHAACSSVRQRHSQLMPFRLPLSAAVIPGAAIWFCSPAGHCGLR
jgi:hypothetical protein